MVATTAAIRWSEAREERRRSIDEKRRCVMVLLRIVIPEYS
jgi:hypothetical protein